MNVLLVFLSLISLVRGNEAHRSLFAPWPKIASKEGHVQLLHRVLVQEVLPRLLQSDFDQVNEILDKTTILIPDQNIEEIVGGETLILNTTNVVCYDVSVHNLVIDSAEVSDTFIDLSVKVEELDLTCQGDIMFDYDFVDGTASFGASVIANQVETDIRMESEDFNTLPPTNATVLSCEIAVTMVEVSVTDVVVIGTALENSSIDYLLTTFEELLFRTIQEEAPTGTPSLISYLLHKSKFT